ncbi:Arginyl-tRNA--protein transferase 1 [Spathaspora sp. JA1]|nr:Arginyl-tRNA--protein transferase 1 [Spathaspora sp. JA1]
MPIVMYQPRYLSERNCGYCHGSKPDHFALESQKTAQEEGNDSHSQSVILGTSVLSMTCNDYDELINMGFRRSGTFLYKPDLLRTCCRQYTIRTRFDCLKITKEHRKVINRFTKEICPELSVPNEPKKGVAFDFSKLIIAQQKSTRFKTRFEPSQFSQEKYQLYRKYQINVHGDKPEEVEESSFRRFLCDTPFSESEVIGNQQQFDFIQDWVKNWNPETNNNSDSSKRIGPTHELYYLDDKLIAFSVLDFLPSGISSIYFVWDPDYAHLSLGTLSGLKEIQMCHELNLGYYYLGYYIDDCAKMKYKAKFGGEVLDVCNEIYFPMDMIKPHMNNGRLFVIADQEEEEMKPTEHELELSNDGYPIDYNVSPFYQHELTNIAETIYTNLNVKQEARKADTLLRVRYKVARVSESSHNIPHIVPGIIPLTQILSWFKAGIINNTFSVRIFDSYHNVTDNFTLRDLTGEGRAIVIDCIRLFGLEKVRNGLIVI